MRRVGLALLLLACGPSAPKPRVESPTPVDAPECSLGPEDLDGFQDDDGCLDPDDDGDGILDTVDACPCHAEDADGFEDEDGCPDLDNDGDRLPDVCDACPNDAELYNGFDDADGCPDRPRVIVTPNRIVILDKIYFTPRSATVSARSAPILDAMAATIEGNPQLRLVEVSGHNASGEPPRLARRRAEAVVAELVARGVHPARLVARGYGASRPIAPNDGAANRARNRRVELQILDGGPPPPPAPPPPPRDEAEPVCPDGLPPAPPPACDPARRTSGAEPG